MNLKKTGAGCLVLIAVLTAALLSAGCLYQPFPGITEEGPWAEVSISVEKTGETYNIGDTMVVIFLGTPEEYPLYVKSSSDGISVEREDIPAKPGETESPGYKFTITALKNGNHPFSIAVGGLYELFEEQGYDVLYTDVMHVVSNRNEPVTPRGVFTVTFNEGSHGAPYAGEFYEISIRGNAMTGNSWAARDSPGLIISNPVYIRNTGEGGTLGTGGVYRWYVTSDTPGDYQFTAYNMTPGNDEPEGRVIVPLSFAEMPEELFF